MSDLARALSVVIGGLAMISSVASACAPDSTSLQFLGFDERSENAYLLQAMNISDLDESGVDRDDWDGTYQVLAVLPRGAKEFSGRFLVSDRFQDIRAIFRGAARIEACGGGNAWRCLLFKIRGADDETEAAIAKLEKEKGVTGPDQLLDSHGVLLPRSKLPEKVRSLLASRPRPGFRDAACKVELKKTARELDPAEGFVAWTYGVWLHGKGTSRSKLIVEEKGEEVAAPKIGKPSVYATPDARWAILVLPMTRSTLLGSYREDVVQGFDPAGCR